MISSPTSGGMLTLRSEFQVGTITVRVTSAGEAWVRHDDVWQEGPPGMAGSPAPPSPGRALPNPAERATRRRRGRYGVHVPQPECPADSAQHSVRWDCRKTSQTNTSGIRIALGIVSCRSGESISAVTGCPPFVRRVLLVLLAVQRSSSPATRITSPAEPWFGPSCPSGCLVTESSRPALPGGARLTHRPRSRFVGHQGDRG